MPSDEKLERLHRKLEEVLGVEEAATLMELLLAKNPWIHWRPEATSRN